MNPACDCFTNTPIVSGSRPLVVRFGSFKRKLDGAVISRYRCGLCKTTFSDSTSSHCFKQKKRHLNEMIYHLLAGGFTQRRAALVLKINRKTVVRKFIFMGERAQAILPKLNAFFPKVKHLQFDELVTSEHTKCKPLSVIMAVEDKRRRILGFRVASQPANGKLASIAYKKYGKRKDERRAARQALFKEIAPFIEADATISSDENPHYPKDVKGHFPNATHKTYKGRRACVVGQGELKKGGFDELYSVNHTFAMCRANMNRLFRRTWSTTKLAKRLGYHLALYSLYHNLILLKKKHPKKTDALRLLFN